MSGRDRAEYASSQRQKAARGLMESYTRKIVDFYPAEFTAPFGGQLFS